MKRSCSWCGRGTAKFDEESCRSCGGPLPALPVSVAASHGLEARQVQLPMPPPAPRTLPKAYLWRKRLTGNVLMIIGLIFCLPFCWTLIFPLIGLPMIYFGWRSAERKITALQNGEVAEGTLLFVRQDTSTTFNGEHPWKLAYGFKTPRGRFEGQCLSWDHLDALRERGEPVRVVYVPGQEESLNALWPPTS